MEAIGDRVESGVLRCLVDSRSCVLGLVCASHTGNPRESSSIRSRFSPSFRSRCSYLASPTPHGHGAFGVVIAWEDGRAGNNDIYALKLLANGDIAPGWAANGNRVCTHSASQTNPTICSDSAGGAIIAWRDARFTTSDVFAQRIDAGGITQWTANGVRLCNAANAQQNAKCVEDGSSGAFVVAPLSARNLERLARRAGLGLDRTGSFMDHGSGDFVIAFSTQTRIPHAPPERVRTI